MTVMTQPKLDVVPLTRHIGAEIRGLDLRSQPDEATVKAIYQAWLHHLVLVFRAQSLSPEDLQRVTRYFREPGGTRRPAKYFPKGYTGLPHGMMLLSNIPGNAGPAPA